MTLAENERTALAAKFRSVARWQGFDDEDADVLAQDFLDHLADDIDGKSRRPAGNTAHMDGN